MTRKTSLDLMFCFFSREILYCVTIWIETDSDKEPIVDCYHVCQPISQLFIIKIAERLTFARGYFFSCSCSRLMCCCGCIYDAAVAVLLPMQLTAEGSWQVRRRWGARRKEISWKIEAIEQEERRNVPSFVTQCTQRMITNLSLLIIS